MDLEATEEFRSDIKHPSESRETPGVFPFVIPDFYVRRLVLQTPGNKLTINLQIKRIIFIL